ncbi:ATP-binding cassette domain-containing protein [Trichocoleus sp. DQ-A3]|uniref:ATP-binding cassette domain-containing protein n=2 Tax=Cyanophyceae TaxID=3028117 RepID=UPI001684CC7C|nr:ATP-binding cassette domain-containing protein [Coleofasciculus sp. FACHB-125]MBD1903368.1 ATP-binding cassette domain-containing protein [Coleofasciculus sp. FACHB-125]
MAITDMHIGQPLLELKDIVFSYTKSAKNPEEKPLLSIEELVLHSGNKIGIIGDNGSGKSTLVKMILGLYIPRGTVNLFGRKVLWGNHYSQLGYIGDPSLSPGYTGLPTDVSVRELLNSFKAICRIERESYSDIQEGLGFDRFLKKDVKHLSNGERKKLMIFLALAKRPKLLIADEATDGLDEKSKQFIIEKIEDISTKSELGILWISHQHHEVARLTDTVYELIEGKLKAPSQKSFNCNIETQPQISVCGSYHNLTSKGWLEIAANIYTNPMISKFEVKGRRMGEGND